MTKTTKTVVAVGCALAVSFSLCALCLVAGAMHDDDPNAVYAPPAPAPVRAAPSSVMNGRYACLTLTIVVGMANAMNVQWDPSALPPFTIDGDSYETSSGSGSVEIADTVASFTGGPYDGWRGFIGSDTTGSFVLFRAKEHHLMRTDGAKRGDFKCYRQKD